VEPCDLLVTELAHVDPVELGRFLAGRQIRRTVVTHFHPKWDAVSEGELRERIVRGAGATGLFGELILAGDGEQIEACRGGGPRSPAPSGFDLLF
jgi:hypothetical protein